MLTWVSIKDHNIGVLCHPQVLSRQIWSKSACWVSAGSRTPYMHAHRSLAPAQCARDGRRLSIRNGNGPRLHNNKHVALARGQRLRHMTLVPLSKVPHPFVMAFPQGCQGTCPSSLLLSLFWATCIRRRDVVKAYLLYYTYVLYFPACYTHRYMSQYCGLSGTM
jgi:hypothetical protein